MLLVGEINVCHGSYKLVKIHFTCRITLFRVVEKHSQNVVGIFPAENAVVIVVVVLLFSCRVSLPCWLKVTSGVCYHLGS